MFNTQPTSGNQYIGQINDYTGTTNYSMQVVQPQYQSFNQEEILVPKYNPIDMFTSLWGKPGEVMYTELSSIRRIDNNEFFINVNNFDDIIEVIKLCISHQNYITARDEIVKLASDPLSEIPWSFSNMVEYENLYIESIDMEFQQFVKRVRPDGTLCPNKMCKDKYIYSITNQVTRSIDEGTTDKVKCANCGLPYEPDFNSYNQDYTSQ